MKPDAPDTARRAAEAHAAQQFAHLLLDGQQARVTPAHSDRLEIARARALARARTAEVLAAPALALRPVGVHLPGASDGPGWFARFGALVSAALLVVGLVALQHFQNERLVRSTADIDTALLLDDLPPAAYADPGFARYLQQQKS